MSSFNCEHCGKPIIDSPNGYVTGCDHYPISNYKYSLAISKYRLLNDYERCLTIFNYEYSYPRFSRVYFNVAHYGNNRVHYLQRYDYIEYYLNNYSEYEFIYECETTEQMDEYLNNVMLPSKIESIRTRLIVQQELEK